MAAHWSMGPKQSIYLSIYFFQKKNVFEIKMFFVIITERQVQFVWCTRVRRLFCFCIVRFIHSFSHFYPINYWSKQHVTDNLSAMRQNILNTFIFCCDSKLLYHSSLCKRKIFDNWISHFFPTNFFWRVKLFRIVGLIQSFAHFQDFMRNVLTKRTDVQFTLRWEKKKGNQK